MSPTVFISPGFLYAANFLPGTLLAQQSLAGGANLFAPSSQAGKEVDAERALPITPFYSTEALKTGAAPGTLVRTEAACGTCGSQRSRGRVSGSCTDAVVVFEMLDRPQRPHTPQHQGRGQSQLEYIRANDGMTDETTPRP